MNKRVPLRLRATQPALIHNLAAALVLEVCVLLRTFGVPLTDSQQTAINAVGAAVLALVAALATRRVVTPTAALPRSLGRPRVLGSDDPNGSE